MDLQGPLEEAARAYALSPLDYNSENDVQARLYEDTREFLRDQNKLELTVGMGFGIQDDGGQPLYADQYHNNLDSSVKQKPLSRVRTELTIWHPLSMMISSDERPLDKDKMGTEILDLVVLRSYMDRPFHIKNGRHRIEIEMIDAAVEIKYPRNFTAVPSNKRSTIDNFSDDELIDIVDLDRLGIQADLEELESLGGDYTITPYLFMCSPYDILRYGSQTEIRHHRLADAAIKKLRQECTETSVLYSYPGGWEWVIRN